MEVELAPLGLIPDRAFLRTQPTKLQRSHGRMLYTFTARFSYCGRGRGTQGRQRRVFKLSGISHGQTFLEVRKDNASKARLEVSVKRQKVIGLSFNFVSDKKNRTTIKNPSDVPEWVKRMSPSL